MSSITVTGYNRGKAVTKSDTLDFDGQTAETSQNPQTCDALFIGGAGVVAGVFQDGTVCNFTVVAGEMIAVKLRRVNDTNTTATLMVALYLQ